MKGFDNLRKLTQGRQRRRPVSLAVGVLVLVVLLMAACGQAAPIIVPPTQPAAAAPTTELPTQPLAAAPTDAPAPVPLTPSVAVADQDIVDGKVTVAQVVSAGPGWLVIHAQKDGQPGSVLGYSPVKEGDNQDVVVVIDVAKATGTLYAMLHRDAGTVGSYEFPGSDGPVLVSGQVVTPAFAVTGGLAAAAPVGPAQTPAPTTGVTPPATAPTATTGATPATTAALPTALVGEAEVQMEDFQFRPKVLVIRAGTTVKFANKDQAAHTATSDTGVFDSGLLAKGEKFTFTFTQPGEYPYYCAPHGGPGGVGMSATIIVIP